MTDHQITNVQDLMNAASLCSQRFGGTRMWWRGHAQSEAWPLRPEIFRAEKFQPLRERSMVGRFVIKARTRYPDCPDRSRLPDWLFLMQHYGMPTRILDWTESILVAAYFVVNDENQLDDDGAIWGLAPSFLNKNQINDELLQGVGGNPAAGLFNEAFHGGEQEPQGPTVAINASEVDIRMLVQRSTFTIHGSRVALEELPDQDKFLQKFVVPAVAKPQLKEIMKAFGYSEANLFPDLEHLAKEIRSLRFAMPAEQSMPNTD